jgi:hypothetical protein
VVDTQFADPIAHGGRISDMAEGEAVETGGDQRLCPLVLQLRSPLSELFRLFQVEHVAM